MKTTTITVAIETLKILNSLALSKVFQKRGNRFRYSNILQISTVRPSNLVGALLENAIPLLWNSIPEYSRNCTNSNQFPHMILSWNGKKCEFTACNDI